MADNTGYIDMIYDEAVSDAVADFLISTKESIRKIEKIWTHWDSENEPDDDKHDKLKGLIVDILSASNEAISQFYAKESEQVPPK